MTHICIAISWSSFSPISNKLMAKKKSKKYEKIITVHPARISHAPCYASSRPFASDPEYLPPPFHELHTILILVLVTTLSAKSFTLYHTYIHTHKFCSFWLIVAAFTSHVFLFLTFFLDSKCVALCLYYKSHVRQRLVKQILNCHHHTSWSSYFILARDTYV